MSAPAVQIKKKKKGTIRYIEIQLKKYKGKYIEVYLKKKGEKYKKVELKTEKIKKYKKGILKIRYLIRKQTVFIKIRTYKKVKKKKKYSKYSGSKKICL
jgi:hypothetical protein